VGKARGPELQRERAVLLKKIVWTRRTGKKRPGKKEFLTSSWSCSKSASARPQQFGGGKEEGSEKAAWTEKKKKRILVKKAR